LKNATDSPMKWFQNKRLEHAHYLIHQEQKKCIRNFYLDIDMKTFRALSSTTKSNTVLPRTRQQKNELIAIVLNSSARFRKYRPKYFVKQFNNK
jgi:hypothetical protein